MSVVVAWLSHLGGETRAMLAGWLPIPPAGVNERMARKGNWGGNNLMSLILHAPTPDVAGQSLANGGSRQRQRVFPWVDSI